MDEQEYGAVVEIYEPECDLERCTWARPAQNGSRFKFPMQLGERDTIKGRRLCSKWEPIKEKRLRKADEELPGQSPTKRARHGDAGSVGLAVGPIFLGEPTMHLGTASVNQPESGHQTTRHEPVWLDRGGSESE